MEAVEADDEKNEGELFTTENPRQTWKRGVEGHCRRLTSRDYS
jgi:hypothetical protein